VFAGDRLEQDYLGAQRVGMKALLIVREGNPMTNVDYITSLREVFDFL
jgi:FMN phosphatase YigB (HAD superfamily)